MCMSTFQNVLAVCHKSRTDWVCVYHKSVFDWWHTLTYTGHMKYVISQEQIGCVYVISLFLTYDIHWHTYEVCHSSSTEWVCFERECELSMLCVRMFLTCVCVWETEREGECDVAFRGALDNILDLCVCERECVRECVSLQCSRMFLTYVHVWERVHVMSDSAMHLTIFWTTGVREKKRESIRC